MPLDKVFGKRGIPVFRGFKHVLGGPEEVNPAEGLLRPRAHVGDVRASGCFSGCVPGRKLRAQPLDKVLRKGGVLLFGGLAHVRVWPGLESRRLF